MQREQDIPGTNRLIHETSPYLLQHARNPVDWYPWGSEALDRARAENKLLLVSIGYSSCHWCHVMERESFESVEIAHFMNEHFVCVKVDREERPDVDHVYMTAVQLMARQGGWPLNCFALPDGRPIYGGTYFPPTQWQRVLQDLSTLWRADAERVERHAEQVRSGVKAQMLVDPPADDGPLGQDLLHTMVARWSKDFDNVHGGADHVPKFPMPNNYEFLLRYGHVFQDRGVLQHVELTLDRMAMGGIFDQVGGGFARYSTDAVWKVPHFEKMLYDNAQLISLYSQAYQAFKKPLYARTVERSIEFILREMTSPEGAFYSALDADSEGVEGLYYVWTRGELEEALGSEYDLMAAYFDIGGQALWEHDRNILRRGIPDVEFAKAFGITEEELEERLTNARAHLLELRSRRTRPALDDKSLTSWNALMVKALCDAYEVFGNERYITVARTNLELLLTKCERTDGGLWHSYKAGTASIPGYLEDHCFLAEALLAMYGITFEEKWLQEAAAQCEHAVRHFRDERSGLFHFTSDRNADLIARPMEVADNVVPASNSSMAQVLFHLGTLLDDEPYLTMADHMLRTVTDRMVLHPSAYSNWAQLALQRIQPLPHIAITGPDALRIRHAFRDHYLPNRIFLGSHGTSELPLLSERSLPETTIFVCIDKNCKLPVHSVEEALRELK